MSVTAMLMMMIAMLIIWGGLALAIVNLNRSSDTPTEDEVRRDL